MSDRVNDGILELLKEVRQMRSEIDGIKAAICAQKEQSPPLPAPPGVPYWQVVPPPPPPTWYYPFPNPPVMCTTTGSLR